MTDRKPFTVDLLNWACDRLSIGWPSEYLSDPHLYLSTVAYAELHDDVQRNYPSWPRCAVLPAKMVTQTVLGNTTVLPNKWLKSTNAWLQDGPLQSTPDERETPAEAEKPAPRGNGGGFEFL